jgi:signal recognition particle subunit SRP19
VWICAESYLYKLIASYLKSHPTTTASPMRFRIQGMPMPKDNKILPPAVPRGSKINQILPLHSPALSGGGVSDNFLQDVMAEMGGQLPPGINPDMMAALGGMGGGMGGAGAGGSVKKVKEKKKK